MNLLHLKLPTVAICMVILTPCVAHAQHAVNLWRGDSLVIGWYDDYPAKDSAYMVVLDDVSHTFRNDTTVARIFWDPTMTRIASELRTHGDSVYTSHYYREGQLMRRNIEDRKTMGWLYTEYFHPNGQLWSSLWPSRDTLQPMTSYHANGQKERDGWWCAMRAFNDWTEWYENGQVKIEEHYERWPIVEPPYRMSLPVGEWRYFKPNGDLEKVEVYEDGKLRETRTK
ncbi:MAG: hypothetical protein IPP83_07045 [Flavobacteriales bacterium]|nr:hypothetical protein [Flavobacteriales bacterium]